MGQPDCRICVVGKFSSAVYNGATACRHCAPASYANLQAMGGCTKCAAGRYGQARRGRVVQCEGKCPPGKYSGSGSQHCDVCAAGTFATGYNTAHCPKCPAGKFGDTADRLACKLCGAGRFSHPGALTSACTAACPVGRYSWPGAAHCTSCPLGQSTAKLGAVSCIPLEQLRQPRVEHRPSRVAVLVAAAPPFVRQTHAGNREAHARRGTLLPPPPPTGDDAAPPPPLPPPPGGGGRAVHLTLPALEPSSKTLPAVCRHVRLSGLPAGAPGASCMGVFDLLPRRKGAPLQARPAYSGQCGAERAVLAYRSATDMWVVAKHANGDTDDFYLGTTSKVTSPLLVRDEWTARGRGGQFTAAPLLRLLCQNRVFELSHAHIRGITSSPTPLPTRSPTAAPTPCPTPRPIIERVVFAKVRVQIPHARAGKFWRARAQDAMASAVGVLASQVTVADAGQPSSTHQTLGFRIKLPRSFCRANAVMCRSEGLSVLSVMRSFSFQQLLAEKLQTKARELSVLETAWDGHEKTSAALHNAVPASLTPEARLAAFLERPKRQQSGAASLAAPSKRSRAPGERGGTTRPAVVMGIAGGAVVLVGILATLLGRHAKTVDVSAHGHEMASVGEALPLSAVTRLNLDADDDDVL